MAVNSETEINLRTLQRVDSNIVEIIDNASQVAIYKYERKLNKWEGTDIEGTLFLYRRSLYPFHGFIIVNRMSTTNFVEVITSDMEFLLEEPYFLYKRSCGEIIGSWFYEERDFRRITNKIQSIVLRQAKTPRRQRSSSDGESQLKKDDAVQDIMSMLSEAHTEYVKADVNEVIPKKNIKEDFNDLNMYTDKKINNKSCGKKSPRKSCMRSSSEEKHLTSPRRRFLSTGSYDCTRSLTLSSNNIFNQILSHSKEAVIHSSAETVQQSNDKEWENVLLPIPSADVEELCLPSKFSSHFSIDDVIMPSLSGVGILDQSVAPVEAPLKSQVASSAIPNVIPETTSSDCNPNWKNRRNDQNEFSSHSSELKEVLVSHLELDSNIMLKIHEAYVASLKSVFTQKKN